VQESRHLVEDLSDEERTSPYPSPLHAGGLIAIRRDYFLRQQNIIQDPKWNKFV
jgi:hypothetical protein